MVRKREKKMSRNRCVRM